MKHLLTPLLLFFIIQDAFGQVTGKLTEVDGLPIPFANVALLKSQDSTLIKSTSTDEKGFFKIDPAPLGKYILKVNMMGYQTLISSAFELTADIQLKDFGTLTLMPSYKQLGEVVIRADRPMVQQQAGGMVVNVQNSILTKGSSALQILERSPGVTIDPRNNSIALNGKSGVMVMVDGKLMRISIAQVVTLLNGMSADNIDKIELLTTPPANYDADGNAGLINIVTKKNKRIGSNGSITASAGYGKGEKASGSINLNHNTENTSLYGSYSYSHNRTYGRLTADGSENVSVIGGPTVVNYLGISKPVSNYHNVIAGFDTKLNSKTTIGGSVNYTNSTDYARHFNNGTYTMRPDSILFFNSTINGTNRGQNITSSFYIEKEISKGEKINLDADYIYYTNNGPTDVQSSFVDNHGNEAGTTDSLYAPRQRGLASSKIQVAVAKADYTKQLGPKLKLQAGTKGTYTRSSGSSGIESLINGEWVGSLSSSSNLVTKEAIVAAYTTFNIQIDTATSLVIGARYEYSHNRTDNASNNTNALDRKLGALFPSVFFSRRLSNNAELQLSYTKRISRPSYGDLASYITYNDPVSVFTGNPALRPTITHNLKLGYNYHGYSFSILLSRDNYPIVYGQVVTGPSKGLVYIAPQNLTYQNNITFQTNLPFKVNNWWSMNYGIEGGWRQFRLDYLLLPVTKAYASYSVNFSETFKLPHSFQFEVSGYYNSPSYYGSGRGNSNVMLNAGIKKELKNNGGSFQLSVTDLLKSAIYNSYLGTLGQDAFSSKIHINYKAESTMMPVIKLTYYKSFGSAGIKSQRKQDSGSKDERDRIGG